ncbi:6-phosphogluconolactonase [Acidimicrobiia bacterium EGI L10123]|uniref:6-phosphogluconolactonase n=1 Tax=Salinilacustrithrix flava TaxID=2957203 RepID=UPI003D7C327C|nr:6-phosphogluconolactonase [Acidimicrobiia bacterium EGI L10123]
MQGDLRIVGDVAAAFCDVVADAWESRTGEVFTIALSGGETARRCYEALARHADTPVDWSEVRVVWGDERCVPLDHEDSNHRLAQESLLRSVGPVAEIHPMQCDVADAYDRLIAGIDVDVIHLGLGPDAHTASLFPESPALDAPADRFVVPNEDPLGNNPIPRLTFTRAAIAAGRTVVVTVEGASKREALDRVRSGEDVPAARIDRPGVVWLTDPAAAGS